VFITQYELSPYIKQIRLVFKGPELLISQVSQGVGLIDRIQTEQRQA
jgi:hypothetical protein